MRIRNNGWWKWSYLMVLVALARSVLQLASIHISRYYSDGFRRSTTQFQLGRKQFNATTVLQCHFYCVGNVLNVEAELVRLLISPTYWTWTVLPKEWVQKMRARHKSSEPSWLARWGTLTSRKCPGQCWATRCYMPGGDAWWGTWTSPRGPRPCWANQCAK
jgi:hypothetical protein